MAPFFYSKGERFHMSDDITDEVEMTEAEEEEVVETVDAPEEDPAEGLKKALVAERKAHKDAARRAKLLEQQLADKGLPADEAALEQAKREALAEGLKAGNDRIKRAEVKAALAGKVTDVALALAVIDTSDIDVDDNGDIDSSAIDSAIADLIEKHPSLVAKRFQGGADQGAKGRVSAKQVTETELENMTPEQINEARRSGRLDALMGVKS